jgi:hypothetical protein
MCYVICVFGVLSVIPNWDEDGMIRKEIPEWHYMPDRIWKESGKGMEIDWANQPM